VIPFHKARGFSFRTVLAMARRLRHDRADVIHGHNPGVHHYAALAARLAGVPVSINTRHSATTSYGVPYQERYFRWVRPLTSHVVFDCDFVQQSLLPRLGYPAEQCSVIINGIPLERFAGPTAAASPGSRRPMFRFGTLGRLVPAKGHSILIEAFGQIAPRLPEAVLSIFGYGELESQLAAQIARLGLEGRVRLEGRTNDAPAALRSLDIFVFSSVNEGLPLVILEAMAAGLPVVSTAVGGVPEILPETVGWLCPAGDAARLAETMLAAAASPDLGQRGESARAMVFERYGIEQMARQYEDLYRTFLKAR
jgi:glycosyltransferase involved in cell wall biosynthesis